MASEKTLERRLKQTIEKTGGLVLKLWCLSFTGLPDRLILLPGGRAAFAEIKTTGKTPSPRQICVHKLIGSLGFLVGVIDTNESLIDFIKQLNVS